MREPTRISLESSAREYGHRAAWQIPPGKFHSSATISGHRMRKVSCVYHKVTETGQARSDLRSRLAQGRGKLTSLHPREHNALADARPLQWDAVQAKHARGLTGARSDRSCTHSASIHAAHFASQGACHARVRPAPPGHFSEKHARMRSRGSALPTGFRGGLTRKGKRIPLDRMESWRNACEERSEGPRPATDLRGWRE